MKLTLWALPHDDPPPFFLRSISTTLWQPSMKISSLTNTIVFPCHLSSRQILLPTATRQPANTSHLKYAVKSFCVVVVIVALVIGTKFSHPCQPAGVNDQVPAPISSLIHGTAVFQPVKSALRHPVRLQPAAVIYAQSRDLVSDTRLRTATVAKLSAAIRAQTIGTAHGEAI